MVSLSCRLQINPPLRMVDAFNRKESFLTGLQRLIGGALVSEPDSADVRLLPAAGVRTRLRFDETHRTFEWELPEPDSAEALLSLWRIALLLGGTAKLLGGEKTLLLHGALLKSSDGGGILLCGQGGMGKSTTAGRWQAVGGECPADDMILLEYGGETLYAHPLPTWSRGAAALQSEHYPVEDALPVKTILALSRTGMQEEIKAVDDFKYMTALYASCAFFYLGVGQKLNVAHQTQLSARVKECAQKLSRHFPPRMFFANLQSNIKQTLGDL